MITQFADGVSAKLADRAAALLLTPAAVFWVGGILAYAADHDVPVDRFARAPTVVQVGAIVLFLLVIMASAAIVNRLSHPFLLVLQGYVWWPRTVRDRARSRWERPVRRDEDAWQALATRLPSLSADERLRYTRLDERLRRMPRAVADYLPTKLGNVLRATELRVREKYGLDTAVIWPRLWLLLPEPAQREISAARGSLNAGVCTVMWGLLFLLWTPWHWLSAVAAVLTVVVGYVGARLAATTFADLVESAFDVHRKILYEALGQPMPTTKEKAHGAALSIRLFRGPDEDE